MGRPPVDEKSWIVEYYSKEGDGSNKYWRIVSEQWLTRGVGGRETMHQRSLADVIEAFRLCTDKVGQYWHGHTWRLRNMHTGEVIPWEGLE